MGVGPIAEPPASHRCADWRQGTAHPENERDRLHLRGLLPPRISSVERQVRPAPCFAAPPRAPLPLMSPQPPSRPHPHLSGHAPRAQMKNVMSEYEKGHAARAASDPDDKIIRAGVNPDNIRKWKVLQVGARPAGGALLRTATGV